MEAASMALVSLDEVWSGSIWSQVLFWSFGIVVERYGHDCCFAIS